MCDPMNPVNKAREIVNEQRRVLIELELEDSVKVVSFERLLKLPLEVREAHVDSKETGIMPFKRHANGGGWVSQNIDINTHVHKSAFVDKNCVVINSIVEQGAEIHGKALLFNKIVRAYVSLYGELEMWQNLIHFFGLYRKDSNKTVSTGSFRYGLQIKEVFRNRSVIEIKEEVHMHEEYKSAYGSSINRSNKVDERRPEIMGYGKRDSWIVNIVNRIWKFCNRPIS